MKFLIFLAFLISNVCFYAQNFPYKLARVSPSTPCEIRVKVGENRPIDCTFGNDYHMYPVFVEEFNYKQELPNNWSFSPGYTSEDNYELKPNKGFTWLGDAYTNNNVYTYNSIGYLEWKKENVYNKQPEDGNPSKIKNYRFTGSMLYSLFKLRQGVFEARIKLPKFNNFWTAYWLRHNQEIDVFEFWGEKTGCGSYNHMQMHVHGYKNQIPDENYKCSRGRKFGVPESFFDDFHVYKCVWTDYQVQIYLDGTLVGTANKFNEGPYLPPGFCHELSGPSYAFVPYSPKSCNYMSTANNCNLDLFGYCLFYNHVNKDENFPTTLDPMQLIISMVLYEPVALYDDWDNIDIRDKRMEIDYVKVYQPVDCTTPRTICSLQDFYNATGNTNFLSGSIIQLGNGSNCSFTNPAPTGTNHWFDFPMHVLYTDQVQIDNANFTVEPGAYCEIKPIDCSEGFNQYQRTTQNGEKLFLTDEEIEAIEQHQNDSLMANDPAFRDSILAYNQRIERETMLAKKSVTDNGAILIHPNPTENYLMIDMPEEDFYDLSSIEIIDNLGRNQNIEKNNIIDVSSLTSGFYQIKFKFTHGIVVVKNFVKK